MITQIELPLRSSFPTVNCYLAAGEKLTIIDAGKPLKGNWKIFQNAIHKAGYEVGNIDQVILTHEHSDHIGLLPEILANSHAVIIAPKMIERHLRYPEQMTRANHKFIANIFNSFGFPDNERQAILNAMLAFRGKHITIPLERLQFFEPNETLTIKDEAWTALHVPGHCPTQFCFVQEDSKRCFGGDMLLPLIPMPIAIEDPNHAGKRMASIPALLQSFQQLIPYDIQLTYPGHGPIFKDANRYINQQITRLHARKEECYKAIQTGHQTIASLTQFLYPKLPIKSVPINIGGLFMTLGYLDLLMEEGRVTKTYKGNTLIYRWTVDGRFA